MTTITITAGWLPKTTVELVAAAVPSLAVTNSYTTSDTNERGVVIEADRALTEDEVTTVRAAINNAVPQISCD